MNARTATLATLLAVAPLLGAPPQISAQGFTLPNGLPVLLLEDHERPLVRIRLQIALEPGDTPQVHPGLPALALRMMDRADAGDLKAADLERAVESAGIAWREEVAPGSLAWHLAARSRDQDRALGLLAQRVMRTLLDPGDLEAQRLAAWREEEWGGHAPRTRLRRALEPDPALRPPTLDSLSAVSFEEVQAFLAKVLRPDRAVLILHGDLGLEQAKRLVLLSFGTWAAPAPQAAPPPPAPLPAAPAGPVLIPAPRTPLRLQAVAAAPPDLSPEAEALLARLLPGDPAPDPVRVDLESSRLVLTLDGGASSWTDLLGRIEALRKRGFSQGDLVRARTAWSEGRALAALDPESLMDEAEQAFRHRHPGAAAVAALDLEALNRALRRWLDPANLRLGATGEPASLKDLARP